jgi:TPP-dependent indolepyruvate ferredoxin oxidoreductase alpha subunit|tara:strand:+ start:363 stop:656 length:294 start_codon:yes stop_codon:yes gene_type:complete
MIDLEAPSVYEKIIQESEHEQLKLIVSTFRDVEYLSIRKYYLDFDEEWKPSNQGITTPIDMENTRNLFQGLVEILSLAESKAIIEENFRDLLDEIYL